MRHLISDIQVVMRYLEKDKSIIMGHDWGGVIAWFFAMYSQTMTERLIVLNTPHPSGIVRELAQNPQHKSRVLMHGTFSKRELISNSLQNRSVPGCTILSPENATLRPFGVQTLRPCSSITNRTTHVNLTRMRLFKLTRYKRPSSRFMDYKTHICCPAV